MMRCARVKDMVTGEEKQVQIASLDKPVVTASVRRKWQSLLDMTLKMLKVPSSLIMQLNENSLEVFLSGDHSKNPFSIGDKAVLLKGFYCESVIFSNRLLVVSNALKTKEWNDNPDVELGFISYLGHPICWPDGEVFGTLCVLDNKENHYSDELRDFFLHIKQNVEEDLNLLVINDDLRLKNIDLECSNRTKTRFLSLISHDIRGSISTTDQVLRLMFENYDDYDCSDFKMMLESVSQSVSSVYLALEDLLIWAKIDLVQLKPEIEEVDVVGVIEEVLQYFHQAVNMKNIDLTSKYSADMIMVKADRKMLIVSIRNIISNALKYTPRNGAVKVVVGQTNDGCQIDIIDNGVGISESDIKKLFSYNESHSKSGTSGESSAGIGLIITKDFLDKSNAKLSIESELGKGSKFTILI